MRILYVDCDSLRPDHLGCYGYDRNTSPIIDSLAADGMRFTNVYASDTACLPSRTTLFSGRFGIHTGVVGHGGISADPRPVGKVRGFDRRDEFASWPQTIRDAGLDTVMISPFPSRHGAFHLLDGFDKWYDTGEDGWECADVIAGAAERWLEANGVADDWFLHVNFWDPHWPYDTPAEYGDPFDGEPAPDWIDDGTIHRQTERYGPNSARDFNEGRYEYNRAPDSIETYEDFVEQINGYDTGIRYMDDHIGRLLEILDGHGVAEETLVIVSADHGENQGELDIYNDHKTADHVTCRVPVIVAGPEIESGVNEDLHYQLDLPPTVADLLGVDTPDRWDGRSFVEALDGTRDTGRPYLVVGNGSHTVQRGVRWDDWLLLETYHDGYNERLERELLFDVERDPHETTDQSARKPGVVDRGRSLLQRWQTERMLEAARGVEGGMSSTPNGVTDPYWELLREGEPFHAPDPSAYRQRLLDTNREATAERMATQSPYRKSNR